MSQRDHLTRRRGRPRTRVAAFAVAALSIVGLAACSSDGDSAESPSAGEKIVLKMYDQGTQAGTSKAYDSIIAAYEKQNPDVTIERTSQGFNAYNTNLKLRLSSPGGPDIFEANVGPGGLLAQSVRDGLVASLDSYNDSFGWTETYPEALFTGYRFDDSFVEGTGTLYGVPSGQAEVCGVYYNKKLLAKINRDVPTTFAEFEDTLAAAKSAGIAPLVVGGLDQWPWGISYMVIANQYTQVSDLSQWWGGDPSVSIVQPGIEQAGDTLRDWVEKGYYADGSEGLSDEASTKAFASGKALFTIQGPWANAGLEEGLGSDLGFFLLPPAEDGAPTASTGNSGWSLAISESSEQKDAAADFLNFVTDPSNRQYWLANGLPAAYPGEATGVEEGSSLQSIVEAYNSLTESGQLGPYLDNAYPYDPQYDFYAGVQELAAGKTSSTDFANLMEDGRDAFQKSLQ